MGEFVLQASAGVASLRAHVGAAAWAKAEAEAHKLKGTALTLELACADDVVALDAALKRRVADGGAAEPEFGALFEAAVGAVEELLAFLCESQFG